MAAITIQKIDDTLKSKLRAIAIAKGINVSSLCVNILTKQIKKFEEDPNLKVLIDALGKVSKIKITNEDKSKEPSVTKYPVNQEKK